METLNAVTDKLSDLLGHRLRDLFGAVFMPETAFTSELTNKANMLFSAYPSDLDKSLADELILFRPFI